MTPMKDLAPHIYRKRVLIEGIYKSDVNANDISRYFGELLAHLGLRSHGNPIIFESLGIGQLKNQGYEAFVPLIDSGIALYTWNSSHFMSVIVFTCKEFSTESAVDFTTSFFLLDPVEYCEF